MFVVFGLFFWLYRRRIIMCMFRSVITPAVSPMATTPAMHPGHKQMHCHHTKNERERQVRRKVLPVINN